MLKKSITYTDFNDNEVTEEFYFHLSKADLIEMEMAHKGGFEKWLKELIAAEDGAKIMAEMKKLILSSYGKKSVDGSRFLKTQALRDDFESSEAYSQLFVELVTDAGVAAEFVNGIVPKGLKDDMAKIQTNQHPSDPAATPMVVPEGVKEDVLHPEPRMLTTAEAGEMTSTELANGLASGRYKLS